MNVRQSIGVLVSLYFSITINAQTLAEKLGYPANSKLIILHIDDIGAAHSENAASIKALTKGYANSTSIMIPCPWSGEAAKMLNANKTIDVGVHLTLTSEWENYKWGPILDKSEVPSLITKDGFFHARVDSFYLNAKLEDVEKETRAQINKAYALGLDITHFDTHMGTMGTRKDLVDLYIKLGEEYKVPVMFSNENAKVFGEYNYPVSVNISGVPTEAFPKKMAAYYDDFLNKLQPGLHLLLFHVAYDDREMQAVTINHPFYGALWRQIDYDYLMNPKTKKLLDKNNIKLVTWRDVRDKIIRKI
jgi:chitin disaccharide deacetylase